MTDLINQIFDIAKGIARVVETSLIGPLTMIFKSLGLLFVKVFELGLMAVKWLMAQL
ncbi:MAG: hypothetical protein UY31_C0008G0018 [Candidatus Wolfebacteria bacterium GW2011_GWE1_48_7]|uniref:Uncharacterized protein n=2 Tax=Candidatus Wolfeibacteriota TaxID=1752735 RepID=A0A0G1WIE9_9BACT|nr:MAG: hypothetical protein UX70_C0001G0674 [Candidatus Wolfebacteria bacterium GW2011_GWB1_47_1]KKU37105.1 MAG: hypothetical protein UX49_C0002G0030 [Candidatus Wolfebacteria bacterium GW2011_GWC2_46_275]KKU54369.1 MAG: hypothetical protein UX76_C0003G0065 [Candidatus Wolfebacteria bacterium GW2011_GWC1_47_103]KKU59506.1 MAG: hypothetical protein UX83_C0004G0008 [Candidatus Wolfebacteria bacterium GW2011_GWE2_47_12]KKU73591.1 MAG: hypothetical protein UX96_C0003G0029 [Candidatus Wolfebacteria